MKRDDHEIERFLDRALNEYGKGSPCEGLEQRILANLAANPTKASSWWAWALVPVAAVVIVLAVLGLKPAKYVPAPPVAGATAPPAPAVALRKTPSVTAAKWHKRLRADTREAVVAKTAPRLPTFPSQPDESQARMLLQFVQRSPNAAQQVVKEEEEFQKLVAENVEDSRKTEQELEMR